MARPTGFEPAISSVTGRRDRPASLRAQTAISYSSKYNEPMQHRKRSIAVFVLLVRIYIPPPCRLFLIAQTAF